MSSIIADLEAHRNAINRALVALREVGGPELRRRGRPGEEASTGVQAAKRTVAKKRILSPEGRQHIIEATKRRWAAKRAAVETASTKRAAKKRAGLTASGRKRLSDLMKARWASKNPR